VSVPTHSKLFCVLLFLACLQVRVRHPELLSLFARHADSKGKQAKLKSPNQLQELLDISRSILLVSSDCCQMLDSLTVHPVACSHIPQAWLHQLLGCCRHILQAMSFIQLCNQSFLYTYYQ
jgi:hypothetical protein